MKKIFWLFYLSLLTSFSYASNIKQTELEISDVLDEYHSTASKADGDGYFSLFTEDAILLGTDANERWTKQSFRAYVQPYFSQGRGWSYTSTERNISVNQQQNMAFFDELLMNENYGQCRGSGVLVKTNLGWKIAQYNLAVTVPNAIAKKVVKQIRDHIEGTK